MWFAGTSIPYREEDDRGTYRLRPGQRADWETSSADLEEGTLHVPKVGKYRPAVLPTGVCHIVTQYALNQFACVLV